MLLEKTSQKHSVPKQLASIDKDFSDNPFLQVCECAFVCFFSCECFTIY